mmetsp:Transcript_95684/g.292614  ORF Transcript_95684/g.292614 Transcript_95684/m.292614 type:complete len:83 (+) Transcript_95684:444-692(+)
MWYKSKNAARETHTLFKIRGPSKRLVGIQRDKLVAGTPQTMAQGKQTDMTMSKKSHDAPDSEHPFIKVKLNSTSVEIKDHER